MVKRSALALCVAVLAVAGCGYTTKSLLPEDIKSVYVAPVTNSIDLSAEISDTERFRVYRPGVEVDLTNAIINAFVFDGTLKVAAAETADAVVEASLKDYRRDALRYSEGDDIQEYRLSILIDVTVSRTSPADASQKLLWHEPVAGDTTFFLTGPRAESEDEAVSRAVEDVARRVIEKTIELW